MVNFLAKNQREIIQFDIDLYFWIFFNVFAIEFFITTNSYSTNTLCTKKHTAKRIHAFNIIWCMYEIKINDDTETKAACVHTECAAHKRTYTYTLAYTFKYTNKHTRTQNTQYKGISVYKYVCTVQCILSFVCVFFFSRFFFESV